jgi:hypothetical protein
MLDYYRVSARFISALDISRFFARFISFAQIESGWSVAEAVAFKEELTTNL